MTTNEIIITNFITSYITNYTEITNIGLNNYTISNFVKPSLFDFITLITSIILCIVPIIALIYSISLNRKLNERNEQQTKEIDKINKYNIFDAYFTKYTEYINSAYLKMLDIYSIHNQGKELINFIFEYLINIESIIYSYEKLKNNNYISGDECVDNNFKNLKDICEYLKNIISFRKKENDIVRLDYKRIFNYLEYIKKYCDIVIIILYEAGSKNKDLISDIDNNIEEIHEEFDKILQISKPNNQ